MIPEQPLNSAIESAKCIEKILQQLQSEDTLLPVLFPRDQLGHIRKELTDFSQAIKNQVDEIKKVIEQNGKDQDWSKLAEQLEIYT